MNLLPALTIGLSFGLVVGLVVYYVLDYFEANEKISRDTSEVISTKPLAPNMHSCAMEAHSIPALEKETKFVSSDGIVVVFDGKTKVM